VSLPSASEIRENIEVEVERSCGIDQHETIMPDLAIALKDKESDLSHSLNPDDYQAQNDSSVDSAVDEMEVMSPSDVVIPVPGQRELYVATRRLVGPYRQGRRHITDLRNRNSRRS